jgi:periplasmic divalent cation tolerance protein
VPDIVFLYVTHPETEAALALGRALVAAEIAACVNVLSGMRTVYRWEGAIEEGEEAVMIVKTRAALEPAAREAILAAHPYACPCVVTIPVTGGNEAYLAWLAASCRAT